MERLLECALHYSNFIVPILALWAIACLYTVRSGQQCRTSQVVFFTTLLAISGLTVRTVMADDCCWLIHTASLGVMVVSGVMRRPGEQDMLMGM